jgi:hypothetical protein
MARITRYIIPDGWADGMIQWKAKNEENVKGRK